jgi:phage repressor protein C with HTH and peptisase S24 domain
LIGRNPAYVQQFIRRGSPKRLAERDRAVLARFFDISEERLGGPATRADVAFCSVARLDIAASAGAGASAIEGRALADLGFTDGWLRRLKPVGRLDRLSVIEVAGSSMLPTLAPGDEILVDRDDTMRRDGIFVLRVDDTLIVKRLVRERARLRVVSDNPEAEPPPQQGYVVIGRVLWAGRRLG